MTDTAVDPIRAVLLAVKALIASGRPITDKALLDVEREARRAFGGAPVYIAARLPMKDRLGAIRADLAQGLSPAETARKHGVSLRTVQRYATNSGDIDDAD